eukprot:CAMPEP_0174931168 /NCGR_PEP_ID=MMETSP1355-20121228/32513_1 /TAXON_ID=464990 /ORGANISM="Hemiselmis tepida, Strain CCMP443" /LENGTH=493 /DNA_ID=CAMNT_0016177503 /DNA_START=76 /DNA_END=1557 /DNA_ORIENTATION=-
MGATFASCTGMQLTSCAISSLCSFACAAVGKSVGGNGTKATQVSRTARVTYLGLFLVTTMVAGIFRDVVPEYLGKIEWLSKNLACPPDRDSPTCVARAFVLRMCCAHVAFHMALALACIGADDLENPRSVFHTGAWGVKTLVWGLAHVATLFMPSALFLDFGWVALAFGVLFLMVQIILFIDWVFAWNESWIDKDGTNNVTGPWHLALGGVSLVGFTTALTLTGFLYSWFGHSTGDMTADCGMYIFFITLNLIAFLFLTGMSFKATEWMPSTGLMPSAMVSLFMTFKLTAGLYAQNQCNVIAQGPSLYRGPPGVVSAISIGIAVILAAYNSVWISGSMEATANREKAVLPTLRKESSSPAPATTEAAGTAPATAEPAAGADERQYPLLSDVQLDVVNTQEGGEDSAAAKKAKEEAMDKMEGPIGYNIAAFHFSFLLGMCYVGMQLTNWNEDFEQGHIDNSTGSMWIKVVDSWMLAAAFGWSMIAPMVLTGREF